MARRRRKGKGRAGESSRGKKGFWARLVGKKAEASRAFDRLTLVLTLVGVCTIAIFTGYLVGQYAIRWVASPLIITERAQDPGTRVIDDDQPQLSARSLSQPPAPSSSTESLPEGTTTTAATTTPAASSPPQQAPFAPAPSGSQPAPSPPQSTVASAPRTPVEPSAPAQPARATVHRVHVGKFANREEAVRVADALKSESPPVPDAWVLFDNGSGQYRVQAGAFSTRQRAEDFVEQLVAMGYDAYIAP